MSIRTWTDGLSRLDVEHDPYGRVRISIHGLDYSGAVVEYGFAAVFGSPAQEEIAQFIKEGM